MKTKLTLGLVAIAALISACTVDNLDDNDYKFNNDSIETQEYHFIAKDSTNNSTDDSGGGNQDPKGGG